MIGPRRLPALRLLTCAVLSLTAVAAVPNVTDGGGKPQARITQVDVSRFPSITVYVSVTDGAGEPVAIAPASIRLYEDGQPVTPDEVRGLGEGESLSTLLVIDVSGSMHAARKLEAAQDAARAYVGQMRPQDRAGVIAFNTEVMTVQPLTSDRGALLAAIDSLQAAHNTALFDAVGEAVRAMGSVEGRKAILVLSDGMDNRSRSTAQQALAGIGPGGLSISTIGLGDLNRVGDVWAGIDETTLRRMAEQAGGSYGYVEDSGSLRQLYERLGRALQSEYAITYTSLAPLRDGVSRSLTVTLAGWAVPTAAETRYNPGGVVPEVAQAAPWPVFLAGLAGLACLLAAPQVIASGLQWLRRRARDFRPAAEPRVRLDERPKPRVRLR